MWKILRIAQKKRDGIYVEAECECKKIEIRRLWSIKAGRTHRCRSCNSGLVFLVNPGTKPKRHGMNNTPTYKCWKNMIQRCTNPNYPRYTDYGGRGIIICERWKIFDNFYEDMGEAPVGLQLDRINNDGNYEKDNCRWVTRKENMGNRRKRTKKET